MSNTPRQSSVEVDERRSALLSNAAAIASVAAAIEGTLGPKGLNCMLVDRFGEVTITNDGRAILERMEVSHPAGRLLVQTAQAQDAEVGDGTTTACLLASTLIAEGVERVLAGVPVAKLVEGLQAGIAEAVRLIELESRPVTGFDDPLLLQAALISGRGQGEIGALVLDGARIAGMERLGERGFRLADWVVAAEGAETEVFCGMTIEKEPMNRQMPRSVGPARVLVIDDALEPEEVEEKSLATEAGFRRYRELQETFRECLAGVVKSKVNVVVVARGVADAADQALTEAGVMVLRRVSGRDVARIAEHTGAQVVKRGGLLREAEELTDIVGEAERIYHDSKLGQVRVVGGRGSRIATMLLGASTAEVRAERQRIAEDAACAVQQALIGGVVAGGGAVEMAVVPALEMLRASQGGMAAYGVDCVLSALRRPLSQIVANAGFNPLEKVEQVRAAVATGRSNVGIDCDRGDTCDMFECGVVDPTRVKVHALRTAAEVAEAVLRISTIIRKRDADRPQPSASSAT